MQVFDRTFRFSRRLEMAQVFERVTKVHIFGTYFFKPQLTCAIQADTIAFVNDYLVSTGSMTRRMLCVAQGLQHAVTSEFSSVAQSQLGAAVCCFIIPKI
jgi:hypothetical protein